MRRLILALALIAAFCALPRVEAVVRNPHGYTLQFHSSVFAAPADATTYYSGSLFSLEPSATAAISPLWVAKAGTVRAVYVSMLTLGTAGSATTSTMSLRLNNTTDTTISAAINTSQAAAAYSNTALNVAVAAGSFLEIKWVTPTWATNPTNVYLNGLIYIDVP